MTKRTNSRRGRPSVFRDKDGGYRFGGDLTKHGAERFETHRRRLAQLAPHVKNPSDADVIEYLARGEENTVAYIAAHAPK
jgi:hypothetical protein